MSAEVSHYVDTEQGVSRIVDQMDLTEEAVNVMVDDCADRIKKVIASIATLIDEKGLFGQETVSLINNGKRVRQIFPLLYLGDLNQEGYMGGEDVMDVEGRIYRMNRTRGYAHLDWESKEEIDSASYIASAGEVFAIMHGYLNAVNPKEITELE